jgi:hypothetical protein
LSEQQQQRFKSKTKNSIFFFSYILGLAAPRGIGIEALKNRKKKKKKRRKERKKDWQN